MTRRAGQAEHVIQDAEHVEDCERREKLRDDWKSGQYTQRELSKKYGLSLAATNRCVKKTEQEFHKFKNPHHAIAAVQAIKTQKEIAEVKKVRPKRKRKKEPKGLDTGEGDFAQAASSADGVAEKDEETEDAIAPLLPEVENCTKEGKVQFLDDAILFTCGMVVEKVNMLGILLPVQDLRQAISALKDARETIVGRVGGGMVGVKINNYNGVGGEDVDENGEPQLRGFTVAPAVALTFDEWHASIIDSTATPIIEAKVDDGQLDMFADLLPPTNVTSEPVAALASVGLQ